MNDRRTLSWRPRKELERARIRIVEPFVRAFANKTREPRETIRSSDCLNVSVEYLLCGRLASRLFDRLARLVGRWTSVQQRETRHHVRPPAAAMTGVAGHDLTAAEVALIDPGNHLHHPARGPLEVVVVGVLRPAPAAFIDMAVSAVHAERRGEEPHRPHELVDRNALEHLNVLEDLLSHRRPHTLCRLAADTHRSQQPHGCRDT